ncbi:unnamed protein product [Linum trigynum]|uniref:Uncharacterized protein n=1 Tax=Linum trigynum TaxID=586398 RepID=A0AAV2CU36_9ROSI
MLKYAFDTTIAWFLATAVYISPAEDEVARHISSKTPLEALSVFAPRRCPRRCRRRLLMCAGSGACFWSGAGGTINSINVVISYQIVSRPRRT